MLLYKIIINNDPSNPLASTGYKINGGEWKVYSDAINLKGVKHITAKSVKYGWKESEDARTKDRESIEENSSISSWNQEPSELDFERWRSWRSSFEL